MLQSDPNVKKVSIWELILSYKGNTLKKKLLYS